MAEQAPDLIPRTVPSEEPRAVVGSHDHVASACTIATPALARPRLEDSHDDNTTASRHAVAITRETPMIDVRFVVAHGLWILGAAIELAAISYYDWLARQRRRPLRQVLRSARGWHSSFAGGGLLVASGFLLMAGTRWWERAVWLVVWAGAAVEMWRLRSPS